MPQGTLYVVATPIGNLEDLTLRAIRVLREADRIVAEDTRRTRGLLSHLGIEGKPVDCVDAHATAHDLGRAIERLEAGQLLAMVTDAGVPSVSDPGSPLVQAALERRIPVVPVPGASAVTAAAAASGFVSGAFWFLGFLPRGGTERAELLDRMARTPEPIILFESPHRTAETLRELGALMPWRPAMVAREMTKVHEEFVRASLAELASAEREWIGEVTVVLAGDPRAGAAPTATDEEVDARIEQGLAAGESVKTVAQRVAAWSGRSRRDVYDRVLVRRGRG